MKKKLFTGLVLLASLQGIQAQGIGYTYDGAGNRIVRQALVVLPPATQEKRDTVDAKETEAAMRTAMQEGISVYPNPTQDRINITVSTFSTGEQAQLTFTDANGKELVRRQVSSEQTEVDVSAYKPGIYYVYLLKGKSKLVYKVSKQ